MNLEPKISVLLVDDSPLVKYGIRAAIESEADGKKMEIIGEASTASAAIRMAAELKPNVILLDLRLPDDSGLNVCSQLRKIVPNTCVIILTSSTDSRSVYDSVIAGAYGFLHKDIDPAGIIKAILDGNAGRPVLSAHTSTNIMSLIKKRSAHAEEASKLSLLSPQERRVLEAVAAGNTNKEVGNLMKLSENTVKNYLVNMFKKLGVERRSQAIALFLNGRNPPAH